MTEEPQTPMRLEIAGREAFSFLKVLGIREGVGIGQCALPLRQTTPLLAHEFRFAGFLRGYYVSPSLSLTIG